MDAKNQVKIGVRELRGKLSHYLRLASAGTAVVVTSRDAVIAVIQSPPVERHMRRPGRLKGKIWMADDFDTLPNDILDAMEAPKF